jgi:farnesyl-diphosphate farnesyltransferase
MINGDEAKLVPPFGVEMRSRNLESILQSVSRSFFLSIKLLPKKLRDPVGVGYLLARSTDTVADTAAISPALREEAMSVLVWAIQGIATPEQLSKVVNSFTVLQSNDAERRLIAVLPECLQCFERLDLPDREDIRTVLGKITEGQMLDLKRFSETDQLRALATAVDLHQYTYLVAGCVGEFWTQLCFRHIHNFSEFSPAEMLELGKKYGMGLQLVNILRDAGTDLRAGRCYFPEEELNGIGLDPEEILLEPGRFETVQQKWHDEAEQGLRSGMQYAHAIRNRRVRGATALPALIGARTLGLLRNAGPTALQYNVKMPRAEVRAMILSVAMRLADREHLRALFLEALEGAGR